MRVCRWLLGVLVLFVGLSGFAQPIPDPPEKDLCVLQGAVKFTDGTPFAGATVSVRVDGKDIMPRPVTDKDGTYTTAVPAGSATISVIGISKQAKLDVGKVNTVDFAFEKEGVVATVSYADGELVPNVNMNGRFRRENKTSASLSFVALGGGRYWFRGIPKDAQEIAILARVYVNSEQYLLQRWNLAELQPMQAVSFVVERPAPLRVLVLDADAKPLVNATITGTISYEGDQPPFWEDERTPAAARRRQPLGNRQTSADGLLDLGSWAARDYELTLRAGTMAGPARAIAVKADMETVRYALDLKPRMITQTIFNADGTAQPNTPVTLGYCWMKQVTYLDATTDAKGQVVWKDVPPVEAVVWGKGVPPGMLPPGATTVTTPLPAPPTEPNPRSRNLRVKLTNLGDTPSRVLYYFTSSSNSGLNSSEYNYRPNPNNPTYISVYVEFREAAPPFTLIAMTKSTATPLVATLANVYLPPLDENEQNELTLSFRAGTALKGRFLTKAGPIKGLSQFRVMPVTLEAEFDGLLTEEMQRRAGLMQPSLTADGAFAVALPGPGTYRLVVDLYDESAPALPELLVAVPAGGKAVDITLPDPMLTVPAGTVLNWLTRHYPAQPRQLAVAAHANPAPVFAPREALLGLWFRPSPDKLVFWNGQERKQTVLDLRAVRVNMLDTQGNPLTSNYAYSLLPLLPAGNYGYSNNPLLARGVSEAQPSPISADNNYCPALWTGQYLLAMGSYGNNFQRFIPVDVTPETPAEITVKLSPPPRQLMQTRSVNLRYTKGNVDEMRRNAAENVGIYFDTTPTQEPIQGIGSYALRPDSGGTQVPMNAKTISLVWQGVGVIRDVPLPAYNANQQGVVDLPAFDPGTTISGKILMADGKPFAKRQIAATLNSAWSQRVTTDDAGAFSIAGVLPGVFLIMVENEWPRAGWTLNVPEQGLKDITLQMNSRPIRLQGLPGGGEFSQVWWFPDAGEPTRLPMRYGDCAIYDLAAGSGMIWAVDGAQGEARYERIALRPGELNLHRSNSNLASGPSLGISFPLDPEIGTPGPVTLIGLEQRAMIKVRFPTMRWQASTLLNRVVGQINAVPPGKYRVIVETPTGITEATVTVTGDGGLVEMTFPKAAVGAAVAPALAPAGVEQIAGPVEELLAVEGLRAIEVPAEGWRVLAAD